jgi:hypothetical protein
MYHLQLSLSPVPAQTDDVVRGIAAQYLAGDYQPL